FVEAALALRDRSIGEARTGRIRARVDAPADDELREAADQVVRVGWRVRRDRRGRPTVVYGVARRAEGLAILLHVAGLRGLDPAGPERDPTPRAVCPVPVADADAAVRRGPSQRVADGVAVEDPAPADVLVEVAVDG